MFSGRAGPQEREGKAGWKEVGGRRGLESTLPRAASPHVSKYVGWRTHWPPSESSCSDAVVMGHPARRRGQDRVVAVAAHACPVLLTSLPLISFAPHSNSIVIPTKHVRKLGSERQGNWSRAAQLRTGRARFVNSHQNSRDQNSGERML